MVRALIAAVAVGIIGGQISLDYFFPEPLPARMEFDAATWKPCPGRKPVKLGKRKAIWYCGPSPSESPNDTAASGGSVDLVAAQGSAPARPSRSRSANPKGLRR